MNRIIYNAKGTRLSSDFCMESISIENYEPCQVRKEAAISRKSLCEILSIEKPENLVLFLLYRKLHFSCNSV